MDAKSLAKSKRAHSMHHKKKHHTQQGLKASSPSAGSDDNKQTSERPAKSEGQRAKERILQFQNSRALPSNWNRYDDDDSGLASENARESSSQLTEFVMPTSNGADYAHMISEAQLDYSSDAVPLFDDFIGDSMQDFGPMLAAKGQSMLSWIADDSFEFEDGESITPQAPFLSLNLDALAEQLAKAKQSERLYLQSDLLPLELPQATNRSNSTSGKPSKFEEAAAEAELDELLNSFSDTAVPREQRIPSSRDAVDILREETSWIVSSKANTESVSSSKNPISKSGIVDDFDSWLDTI